MASRVAPIEREESERLKNRFVTRARAVFWVRLGLIAFSVVFLLASNAPHTFQNPLRLWSWIWLGCICAYTCLAQHLATHPRYGRWAQFSTLNLDLIWYGYLALISGGLFSPLMAISPILTLLFALLFHSPITMLPPLLLLPVITALHAIWFGSSSLVVQICILGLHAILSSIVVYLTNYSLSQEESQNLKIVRLERQLKKMAVVEERQRLSRDIHDGLGAALSGLIIQSEYLLSLTHNNDEVTHEIRELKGSAEEAIDEVRRALSMMRDEFDLIPQLKNCCNTFSSRHKLPANLSIEGTPPKLSDEEQLTIFRIMQECLTNTSKHAKAKSINVKVQFSPSALQMSICDDGIGFDPQIIPKNHYGLLNMKERAKKIGGQIHVESTLGHGTQVELSIAIK